MMLSGTFDILGPIMAGPSSSHTAGALRMARLAASLCTAQVVGVRFTLYNSFARTHRGHGTDRALIAGVLGMDMDDGRIRDAYALAEEAGLAVEIVDGGSDADMHANTVDIEMACADGSSTAIRAESVGGGAIRVARINGVAVDIDGDLPTLVVAHKDEPGMLALMTSALGDAGVNIAYMSSYRTAPGSIAYAVFETDAEVPGDVVGSILAADNVVSAHVVTIPGSAPVASAVENDFDFSCGQDLLALCGQRNLSIGAVMRAREYAAYGRAYADERLAATLEAMRSEVAAPIADPQPSLGRLIGGEAARLRQASENGLTLSGSTLSLACAYAMAVVERSAVMGVIVAAPTAGSSGIVPGCLIAASETLDPTPERLELALYCSAAVGAIVERRAGVSGARGGCQAEVGTASAMAAAALVELSGGSPRQALAAASIAIANLLGLVCDPVGGLVEIPCQARNAAGAAAAFTARDLAMAGIELPIPFDEVVGALDEVGRSLPAALRETALGGLAACPSVCAGCA